MLEPKFSSVLSTAVPVSCFDSGPITEMWRLSPPQSELPFESTLIPTVLLSAEAPSSRWAFNLFQSGKTFLHNIHITKKSFYFIVVVFLCFFFPPISTEITKNEICTYFPGNWMSVLKWSFVFSFTCGGRLLVTLNLQGQGSFKHQWALGMQERSRKLGWRRGPRRA